MGDKELWTTFEKTGNVMDYLNYKGIHAEQQKNNVGEITFIANAALE